MRPRRRPDAGGAAVWRGLSDRAVCAAGGGSGAGPSVGRPVFWLDRSAA